MILRRYFNKNTPFLVSRVYASTNVEHVPNNRDKFETVYSFPFIKYFALFNRLKVYHFVGSAAIVPVAGCLELANVLPEKGLFFTSAYISMTAAALLSLGSLPFRNIIGFIYIDNEKENIKLSYLNYWGKRVNKVVPTEDWTPLNDIPGKIADVIFVRPHLADGTKFKLFVKHGNVHRPDLMGEVLE